MPRLVLVRHGRPLVDPAVPPAEWALAEDGLEEIRQVGRLLDQSSERPVVASSERKAIETAVHLRLSPAVIRSERFVEVSKPWYDDLADQRMATSRYFAGDTIDGWEPLTTAIARFQSGIDEFAGQDLVVVTHGTVMTAWLASIGAIAGAEAFWSRLRMPDAWEVDLRQPTIRHVSAR